MKWTNDCQGKMDYDGEVVSINTRLWPPNYDANGRWTATSDVCTSDGAVVYRIDFSGATKAECQRAVEIWAGEAIKLIDTAARSLFQGR